MTSDPYSDYRATRKERSEAGALIAMLANSVAYKDPVDLCYVCNKILKSNVCPKCHKGVCNECLGICSNCKNAFCYFCLTKQYSNDGNDQSLCPDCLAATPSSSM